MPNYQDSLEYVNQITYTFFACPLGWELAASEEAFRFHDLGQVGRFAGLIAVGGAIAFFMELFEFLIVFKSSGLTLSIVGAVKVRCPLLE